MAYSSYSRPHSASGTSRKLQAEREAFKLIYNRAQDLLDRIGDSDTVTDGEWRALCDAVDATGDLYEKYDLICGTARKHGLIQ